MLICFICKAHQKSSALLCQHLRLRHGLYPGKTLRLKCGQPGCSLSFCTYPGFKKHLVRLHKDTCSPNKHLVHLHRATCSPNTIDNVDAQSEGDEPSSSQAFCTDTPVTSRTSVDKHHLLNLCGSVVAQLQASGVAESTVQAMVGTFMSKQEKLFSAVLLQRFKQPIWKKRWKIVLVNWKILSQS